MRLRRRSPRHAQRLRCRHGLGSGCVTITPRLSPTVELSGATRTEAVGRVNNEHAYTSGCIGYPTGISNIVVCKTKKLSSIFEVESFASSKYSMTYFCMP